MLDSIPVPFQAILWALAGAALVLALGRWLPNWARRLLAALAALASLASLWSLRTGPVQRVEISWEPVNFFRMSPTLYPDGLSLLGGVVLAGVAVALVLGIRGSESCGRGWHGWLIVVLAGGLASVLASNLMALALGSALIDLALLAIALLAARIGGSGRGPSLGWTIPGIASTLLLFLAALRMDALAGHASLLARNLPQEAMFLVGVAGLLRLLVFPLHPRGVEAPEGAATLLLPVGVGVYLLARVQSLTPILLNRSWLVFLVALALLAGGVLAWGGSVGGPAGRKRRPIFSGFWTGALVHQTAFALAFVLLLAGTAPWSFVALALALGILTIWWDGVLERPQAPRPGWVEWILGRTSAWRDRAWSHGVARFPRLERWQGSGPGRWGSAVFATIALASLAGAPFTIGARARWATYAAWLEKGDSAFLVALAADTLLAAGLWLALGTILKQSQTHRPRLVSLLTMLGLVISIVVLGIAPGVLGDRLGLDAPPPASVSAWGLGLLYVLPWLLGGWLARLKGPVTRYLDLAWDAVDLDWFYRAAAWLGQRLVNVGHWVARVGEGEGWWGWALIILALGIILLTAR